MDVSASTYASNKPTVVIRDPMFQPFNFITTPGSTSTYFKSNEFDVMPWIAIDLGSTRKVDAVEISQLNSTAFTGEGPL